MNKKVKKIKYIHIHICYKIQYLTNKLFLSYLTLFTLKLENQNIFLLMLNMDQSREREPYLLPNCNKCKLVASFIFWRSKAPLYHHLNYVWLPLVLLPGVVIQPPPPLLSEVEHISTPESHDTRDREVFYVQHVRTSRLRDSAIPRVQRALNADLNK